MTYNIVALPGDGIGPEILNGSLSLLEIISNKYNFNYQIEHHEFGGASIDTFGEPLTEKTLNACKRADAILLETFNIKLLIIQKVKQHNIKVYNFIIINNTSYKIKF